MNTLPLVAPEARDLAAQFPVFAPGRESLAQYRDRINALYASAAPTPREQHTIPGPAGAPDVRVLLYRPTEATGPLPAIFYIHGGGFITGTPDMMDAASLQLARDSAALVVAVNYRLAPETPFPGPLEDCYAALGWLFRQADALGIDAARVVVLGHSSGGGLAAALALLTRDRGEYVLQGQVLIYPMLDARTGTAEAPVDNPATGEFLWTRTTNHFGWEALRGNQPVPPARLGHFSPALAEDVAGLPPTFLGVGSLDLFLEEDMAYALRLTRAGVPVEAHIYNGGIHGFDAVPGPLADQYHVDLKAALQRLLHPNRAASPAQAPPATDLQDFYRRYLACCNAHRLDGLGEFVHDPIDFNGQRTSLADYAKAIASFIEVFPDFHWTLLDLLVEADTIAVHLSDTGTQHGEWLGLPPTGRAMKTQEMAFYRLREGKIAEMWYVLDVTAAKLQLEQD